MKWFPPCFALLAAIAIFVLFACSGDDSIPEEDYYDNGTPVSSSVSTPNDSSPSTTPSSSSEPEGSLSSSDEGGSSSSTGTSSSSTGGGDGGASSSSTGGGASSSSTGGGASSSSVGGSSGEASSSSDGAVACTGTQLTTTGVNTGGTGSASSSNYKSEFNYCCTGDFQIAYVGLSGATKDIIVTGGCIYTGATGPGNSTNPPASNSYTSICSNSTGALTLKPASGVTWSNMFVRCM